MRALRWIVSLVFLAACLAIVLAIASPVLLSAFHERILVLVSDSLGYRVRAGSVAGAPFVQGLRVTRIEVGDPIFAVAAEMQIDVRLVESLRRRRPVVRVNFRRLGFDETQLPAEQSAAQSGDAGWAFPLDLRVTLAESEAILAGDRSVGVRSLSIGLEVDHGESGRTRVEAEGLRIREGGRVVHVPSANAAVDWRQGVIRLSALSIEGAGVRVSGASSTDDIASSDGTIVAPTDLEITADLSDIDGLFWSPIGIDGDATVHLAVGGNLWDLELRAAASVDHPRWGDLDFDRFKGVVSRDRASWTVSDLVLESADGRAEAELAFDEVERKWRGTVGWRRVGLSRFTGIVPQQWKLMSSGDATIEGDLGQETIGVSGSGRVGGQGREDVPFNVEFLQSRGRRTAQVSGQIGRAGPFEILLDRLDWDDLSGRASVDVRSLKALSKALDLKPSIDLDGAVRLTAELSGSGMQPKVAVQVASPDVALADGRGASVAGRGVWNGSAVDVERLAVVGSWGTLTGRGKLALSSSAKHDWQLSGKALDLGAVDELLRRVTSAGGPALRGRCDLELFVRGSQGSPQFGLEVSGSNVSLGDLGFGTVQSNVSGDGSAWTATTVATPPDGRAEFSLSGRGTQVEALRGEVDGWPIANLGYDIGAAAKGKLEATLNFTVADGRTTGRSDVKLVAVHTGDRALEGSTLQVTADGREWKVVGDLLGGAALVEGQAGQGSDSGYALQMSWNELAVPQWLLDEHGEFQIETTGLVSVRADRRGAEPLGSAEISHFRLVSGQGTLQNDGAISLRFGSDGAQLSPFSLRGGDTNLQVLGQIQRNSAFRLEVEGPLGLAWVDRWVAPFEIVKGFAQVRAEIEGRGGNIESLRGHGEVKNAAFEFPGGLPVTGVDATIDFDMDGADFKHLSGDIGGGKASVVGRVSDAEGVSLGWQARNVSVEPADHLEVVVGGEGRLDGPWGAVVLSGALRLADLLYDRNLSLQDVIPSFNRVVDPAPTARPATSPLILDLRVKAADGLYVENNVAVLEARTDLHITGDLSRPVLDGSIEVIDGQVKVRDRTFEIVNGRMAFSPERRGAAGLDFLAESVIDTSDTSYGVQVRVSGTTERYRVALESDEGLGQTDIASLIAFGKTVAQLQDGGAGDAGLSVESLFDVAGGQLGNLVSGELVATLPFDEVELRPGFSTLTGEFEPQIRVGKRLSENFSAWVAQTFGVQSQTSIEANYQLGHQLATILRWESQTASQEGAFGGELSQRVEFWGLPRWLTWGTGD